MSFGAKLEARREAAREKPCECWDCLRAAGLTPEKSMADLYPSRYPRRVMRCDNGETDRQAAEEREAREQAEAMSVTEHLHSRVRAVLSPQASER